MKMRLLLVVLIAQAVASFCSAQEVVDRVVAIVNGRPVLQSDWESQQRYEAFLDGQPLTRLSGEALERVIDQELIRQQRKGKEATIADAEVEAKIAEVRRQTAGAGSDAGWQAALARYGLTESELRERVAAQLAALRYIDQRLRPGVHIDRKAVEAYYRESFLPALRQRGGSEVPLADVSAKIEEILAQQQMDQTLAAWLQELRRQASLRLLVPTTSEGAGKPAGGSTQ